VVKKRELKPEKFFMASRLRTMSVTQFYLQPNNKRAHPALN